MKFASSVALSLFFASGANAFGTGTPVQSSAFGVSSGTSMRKGDMSMRIGTQDMSRKQKFNRIIHNPTKEVVESQIVTPATSELIKKCSWRMRKAMIRKVKRQAARFDVEVESSFGVPPNQAGREQLEQAASVARKAKKEAEQEAVAATPAPVAEPAAPKEEASPAPVAASDNAVTPKTIKALRDNTGAGMMDCKKALIECDGDQEAAADYLRKKGLVKADKKATRIAAEGKIAFASSGSKAVMVEVNCETDFVGKDSTFLAYCNQVANAALGVEGDSVEALMTQESEGETLEATRQALVAKIGENIQVRRINSRGGEGSTVGCYVHMGRIGVLVELEGGSEQLCTDVAMHVAAMNPPFAVAEEVPQDVLEKEKKVLSDQALESGKPEAIVEKMVEGRIRKYLEEICLVSQNYVRDSSMTVGQYLEKNGAKMVGFTRVEVGEGIEKREDDFAAEVAAMSGSS